MGVDDSSVSRAEFRSLMVDFFGYDDELLTGNMFDASAWILAIDCHVQCAVQNNGG